VTVRWQAQIEKDDTDFGVAMKHGQSIMPVVSLVHVMTDRLDDASQETADVGLVLDDQGAHEALAWASGQLGHAGVLSKRKRSGKMNERKYRSLS
jgi:hypothetical protein